MTSFTIWLCGSDMYYDPQQGIYQGSIEMYNQMNGLLSSGNPMLNPISGQNTKFALDGDPVNDIGWYEGGAWEASCGDRKFVMNSGPFDFAPGDSQEVVYAIIMARGEDRLDSVEN